MLAYNNNDRPSLKQIREHDWMQGETPAAEEVQLAMSMLKSKFIQQEVQHQSQHVRTKIKD